MDGRSVVGRDVELGSIDAFLGRVWRGPAALLLAGDAGIGKTILWEAGVDAAQRRFGRVLTCRSVEAEAALSFAGLSELLAPCWTARLRRSLSLVDERWRWRSRLSSPVSMSRTLMSSAWLCWTCSTCWRCTDRWSWLSTIFSGWTPPQRVSFTWRCESA